MSRDWRSVGLVAGWQTAASLCYYSIFAATGFVRESFTLSESLVGLFLTAALVGYTVTLFPSGAAVDGYGERPVMIAGLLALAAAAVGVSFAPTYATVLAAGGVLGAAYSTAMPASNRGIVAHAPAGQTNLAMGLKQVGVTAGSAAASLLVTGVAAVLAWQVGFWVIAILAVGYAALFAARYRGQEGTGELSVPDVTGLFEQRAYAVLVAAGLFLGASIFTMLGYIVLYVQDAVGASAAIGGIALALTQITGSVARVGAGSLADRLGGARGAALVALGQLGLGTALFGTLAFDPGSLVTVLVLFAGLGLSIHGSTGVFYSCLTDLADGDEVGAATAGGQTAINVGGVVTPPIFGFLVETGGYDAAWALLALTAGAATLLLLLVTRRT
ncbi:MFS transporter [Halobellus sp. Atlit-38R]|uniref:MFS transporter n=1 Tax=Halobellus sp. Atlit-38R TaxID=2282131 RepID=UPI000EF21C70|nr:MFS transporter [Halobellus sp. Atlit-38R]RLM84176.1 MFS transporter [Halobellus sp. Atlit-38R]